ncbi:holliday junction DNA helicase RuvA [Candidatus Kinetoplastibacterium blastocrithidii TCC012E]|uniref:Holliday junction branch migration complex subunit RuvA n=1 Tax=Candidatus Kinetoplastidibacterium blastocrithidiae TCC012E TaxID=1208922 RepID=M1LWR5_9PROT|nr:Holliday junction branch migration protein RuvA [Candidatus Kinetoplastibacterium blastocrithidii]AFZ83843.1 holliday junction DNA helicase RuvA [Candidatus Kinetoplastibacterium blastocrithidii (ex Strigomonas culicis)]AGF49967.1 holliday junction DNA helicase RuvA [Candidatus Kinetoplastibacterium blastocrithidii TCC012E]
MIERITGKLIEKSTNSVCLDVNGICYEIEITSNTINSLPAINEQTTLFTHLLIREDAHILFGFNNPETRNTFRLLIKTAGIGARTALSVLSTLTVDELSNSILMQEPSILTKVPGIGQKTAERLLLELKNKIKSETGLNSLQVPQRQSDIINALVSLGYSYKETIKIINLVPEDLALSESIKYALKLLSSG